MLKRFKEWLIHKLGGHTKVDLPKILMHEVPIVTFRSTITDLQQFPDWDVLDSVDRMVCESHLKAKLAQSIADSLCVKITAFKDGVRQGLTAEVAVLMDAGKPPEF